MEPVELILASERERLEVMLAVKVLRARGATNAADTLKLAQRATGTKKVRVLTSPCHGIRTSQRTNSFFVVHFGASRKRGRVLHAAHRQTACPRMVLRIILAASATVPLPPLLPYRRARVRSRLHA